MAIACFAVGAGAVTAATRIIAPDAAGIIHTCFDNTNGNWRVVNSAADCRTSETALNVNQNAAAGLPGPAGSPGPKGDTGPQGLAGAAGATGATGTSGSAGAIGATGPQGPTGDTGTAGTNGATGAVGATGATGAVGATGATGAGGSGGSGSSGATGATGSTGSTGGGGPSACTWPASGTNVYVIDGNTGANRVIRANVSTGQECIAWAPDGNQFRALTTSAADAYVYIMEFSSPVTAIDRLDPATGSAGVITPTGQSDPRAMAFGPSDGMIYVLNGPGSGGTSAGSSYVSRVDPATGTGTTVFTFPTSLTGPRAIAVSPAGLVYVLDVPGAVWRIDPVHGTGSVLMFLGVTARDMVYSGGSLYLLQMGTTESVARFDAGTGGLVSASLLTGTSAPNAMALGGGTLYFTDTFALGGLGAVWSAPVAGGTPTLVSSSVIFTDPIAIAAK